MSAQIAIEFIKSNPEAVATRIRQLERENAQLRADKERLDWLEGQAKDIMLMGDESGIAVGAATNFQNYVTNAVTFRAAIDAARKEAQP